LEFESLLICTSQADIPGKIHLTSAAKREEALMQGIALQSGWENLLLAAPFVGMVLVGIFRLDQIAADPKHQRGRRPRLIGNDENGRLLLGDPDGRPWADSRDQASTATSD
jgi:hypothetical protein